MNITPKYIIAQIEETTESINQLENNKKDRHVMLNIPIQVLWGKHGVIGNQFSPLDIWQKYSKLKVIGKAMPCGHFIPEEDPKGTIEEIINFIKNF